MLGVDHLQIGQHNIIMIVKVVWRARNMLGVVLRPSTDRTTQHNYDC